MVYSSGVLETSRHGRYSQSPLPVFSRWGWGIILGCTNEGIYMWRRKRRQIWLPTVKTRMALVWVRALLHPSWSCWNLSCRGSYFCGGSTSLPGTLLITSWIFLPALLQQHYLPTMPMYEMISMGSGSLCPLYIDWAPILKCCHISH